MTIEVAAAKKAISDSEPFDLNDPTLLPDVYVKAVVGFDLSNLGAQSTVIPGEYGSETAVSALNYPRLIASIKAALSANVDFVHFTQSFHTQAQTLTKAALLDGVRAAHRIVELIDNGGICVEVPFNSDQGLVAVGEFLQDAPLQKSVSIKINKDANIDLLKEFSARAKKSGVNLVALIKDVDFATVNAQMLAEMVDVVQLREPDVLKVRNARFALREAALNLGKKIRISGELGIVISATMQSAEERAGLISALNGKPLFDDVAKAIGTVYDVADVVEKWISCGAVDGIVFKPASLPTDLASVIKGVLPLLKERAKMDLGLPRS